MKILICGANGFLGRHITASLQDAGHEVCLGVRKLKHPRQLQQAPTEIAINFASDTSPAIWGARLRQLGRIDVIINAVGIFNESGADSFDAIHRDGPIALFQAAQACGIKTVIQISALGSKEESSWDTALTPYMRSKRATDDMLMRSDLHFLILRPSLVVGLDGGSSQLFRSMASMPLTMLPGSGDQQVQPVHVDDLCTVINHWLADPARQKQILHAVGPVAMSYRQMLENYRTAMGMPPQYMIELPMPVMRAVSKCASLLPSSVLTPDSLRMLEQGNVADAAAFATHLGAPAKSAKDWFKGIPAQMLASAAIAHWSQPLFRYVLALIWFVTAALSFGIYPIPASLALLQPLGLSGTAALLTLMAASSLDFCLGIASLLWPRRLLWLIQIGLITGYSIIIALFSPEYYLHPFGPILKNLPILAVLAYLYAHQRDTTQRETK